MQTQQETLKCSSRGPGSIPSLVGEGLQDTFSWLLYSVRLDGAITTP